MLKHFNPGSLLPGRQIYSSWSKVKYRFCLGGSASLPSPTNEVQHTTSSGLVTVCGSVVVPHISLPLAGTIVL